MGKRLAKIRAMLKSDEAPDFDKDMYRHVAEMIKDENPTWSTVDTELLVFFITIAMSRYKKSDFDGYSDDQIRERIRNAFESSPEAQSVTPGQLQQLNAMFTSGSSFGSRARKLIKNMLTQTTLWWECSQN